MSNCFTLSNWPSDIAHSVFKKNSFMSEQLFLEQLCHYLFISKKVEMKTFDERVVRKKT